MAAVTHWTACPGGLGSHRGHHVTPMGPPSVFCSFPSVITAKTEAQVRRGPAAGSTGMQKALPPDTAEGSYRAWELTPRRQERWRTSRQGSVVRRQSPGSCGSPFGWNRTLSSSFKSSALKQPCWRPPQWTPPTSSPGFLEPGNPRIV